MTAWHIFYDVALLAVCSLVRDYRWQRSNPSTPIRIIFASYASVRSLPKHPSQSQRVPASPLTNKMWSKLNITHIQRQGGRYYKVNRVVNIIQHSPGYLQSTAPIIESHVQSYEDINESLIITFLYNIMDNLIPFTEHTKWLIFLNN